MVSWKTSPMLRRTSSCSVRVSWPATLAEPDVALASVQRILMVVVLPAPFGPRKPKVSPRTTSKSIPRTASTSSYRLVRLETDITAGRSRSPASEPVPACVAAITEIYLLPADRCGVAARSVTPPVLELRGPDVGPEPVIERP